MVAFQPRGQVVQAFWKTSPLLHWSTSLPRGAPLNQEDSPPRKWRKKIHREGGRVTRGPGDWYAPELTGLLRKILARSSRKQQREELKRRAPEQWKELEKECSNTHHPPVHLRFAHVFRDLHYPCVLEMSELCPARGSCVMPGAHGQRCHQMCQLCSMSALGVPPDMSGSQHFRQSLLACSMMIQVQYPQLGLGF